MNFLICYPLPGKKTREMLHTSTEKHLGVVMKQILHEMQEIAKYKTWNTQGMSCGI